MKGGDEGVDLESLATLVIGNSCFEKVQSVYIKSRNGERGRVQICRSWERSSWASAPVRDCRISLRGDPTCWRCEVRTEEGSDV